MTRQSLSTNTVEPGECTKTIQSAPVSLRMVLDRGDHDVSGGMLRRDKFKHLCAVASPLEQLGTQGVGDKFGLPFPKDAVSKCVGEDIGRLHDRTQFLLTTRGDYEKLGICRDPPGERIVGRSIAGMEGNQDFAPAVSAQVVVAMFP
jgi:hypothetical protein